MMAIDGGPRRRQTASSVKRWGWLSPGESRAPARVCGGKKKDGMGECIALHRVLDQGRHTVGKGGVLSPAKGRWVIGGG